MASSLDPNNPVFLDEASVRTDLTEAFDLCIDCRRCDELCGVFPAVFAAVDRHPDREAGRMTPEEQDHAVDSCHFCRRCVEQCPYASGRDPRGLDMARLLQRAVAMRRENGQLRWRRRLATVIARSAGARRSLATRLAPLANAVLRPRPRSTMRRALAVVAGVSAERMMAPFVRERFSTWFRRHRADATSGDRVVELYPTCIVEYHAPAIGRDLVRVLEHHSVSCIVDETVGCCGAPYLDSGDLTAFYRTATSTARRLAAAVRAGRTVVVAQERCAMVIREEYPRHLGGPEVSTLAASTCEPAEFFCQLLSNGELRTDVGDEMAGAGRLALHLPCSSGATNGSGWRQLFAAAGVDVTEVRSCAGNHGGWGGIAANDSASRVDHERLRAAIESLGQSALVGSCHDANLVLSEVAGSRVVHPVEVLARLYGLVPDEDRPR